MRVFGALAYIPLMSRVLTCNNVILAGKATIARQVLARSVTQESRTPTSQNGERCKDTMARNLRRFHAHQIKNAGRRYYDKSLVAQKLVLEKELQYPQNILPFFVKPFLSALH